MAALCAKSKVRAGSTRARHINDENVPLCDACRGLSIGSSAQDAAQALDQYGSFLPQLRETVAHDPIEHSLAGWRHAQQNDPLVFP